MQVVAHNMLAQFTSRQLKIVTGNKAKISERLSSGYRINRSADDAAGLAISEKMRYQIRGLNKHQIIYRMEYHLCRWQRVHWVKCILYCRE